MTNSEEAELLKIDRKYSGYAKRITENLKPIYDDKDILQKRWLFELIQNASDLKQNVDITITYNSDKLIFEHNGPAFDINQAYNLIMPDSTKDSHDTKLDIDQIGQFGTGFLSTHILSSRISIEGFIRGSSGKLSFFETELDRRNREDKDALVKAMRIAEAEIDECVKTQIPEPNELFTRFTYHLNSGFDNIEIPTVIKEGLYYFNKLIPYILPARKFIKSIKIIDNTDPAIIHTTEIYGKEVTDFDFKIYETNFDDGSDDFPKKVIGYYAEEDVNIMFPINIIGDRIELLSITSDVPKLFCGFPIISRSNFDFPVIINSARFIPDKERDGIELGPNQDNNRNRILSASKLYCGLLETVLDNKYENVWNVCSIRKIVTGRSETDVWLEKNVLNVIKNNFFKSEFITSGTGYKTKLESIYIPTSEVSTEIENRLYDSWLSIYPGLVPDRNTISEWRKTIDLKIFPKGNGSFDVLFNKIQSKEKTLNGLVANSFIKDLECAKVELVKLVTLIIDADKVQLLNKYKILFDQANNLVLLGNVKFDGLIKQVGKDHADRIKKLRNYFLNPRIEINLASTVFNAEEFKHLHSLRDFIDVEDIALTIDNGFKNIQSKNLGISNLDKIQEMFSWIDTVELSKEYLKSKFGYFTSHRPQLFFGSKSADQLQDSFTIERSGLSKSLANLAKTKITKEEIQQITLNIDSIKRFLSFTEDVIIDKPDKELVVHFGHTPYVC